MFEGEKENENSCRSIEQFRQTLPVKVLPEKCQLKMWTQKTQLSVVKVTTVFTELKTNPTKIVFFLKKSRCKMCEKCRL